MLGETQEFALHNQPEQNTAIDGDDCLIITDDDVQFEKHFYCLSLFRENHESIPIKRVNNLQWKNGRKEFLRYPTPSSCSVSLDQERTKSAEAKVNE